MRLLPCPSCKTKLSQQAVTCPKCGQPLPNNWNTSAETREMIKGGLVLGGVAAVAILTGITIGWPIDLRSPETAAKQTARKSEKERCGYDISAIVAAEGFVRKRLKAPSTAHFATMGESRIAQMECGRWNVSSYVDAQNSFGAVLRMDYRAIVKWQGNENWTLENLSLRD